MSNRLARTSLPSWVTARGRRHHRHRVCHRWRHGADRRLLKAWSSIITYERRAPGKRSESPPTTSTCCTWGWFEQFHEILVREPALLEDRIPVMQIEDDMESSSDQVIVRGRRPRCPEFRAELNLYTQGANSRQRRPTVEKGDGTSETVRPAIDGMRKHSPGLEQAVSEMVVPPR